MDEEKILVVEDDADIGSLLKFALTSHGYNVDMATDGEAALSYFEKHTPSLVLLDIMLPKVNGIDVLKNIRYEKKLRHLPVIIISARQEESDIVTLLELGADDYLPKPFSTKVLLVKVKTLIQKEKERSLSSSENTKRASIIIGPLELNSERHTLKLNGKNTELSATEFSILETLLSDVGRTFTRDELMEKAKGGEYYSLERTIDVQVASIRKKLGSLGSSIKTVWGVGYKWENKDEA